MDHLWLAIILMAAYFNLAAGDGTILEFGLSEDEQNEVLDLHNDCRLQIANGSVPGQPKGINLLRLIYDSQLAEAAQEIANTTVYQHVGVNDTRFLVGQNLYLTSSTGSGGSSNWTGAVTGWFSEYSSYEYEACCPSLEQTGHYTQVVWAETQYVGCGYTFYYDDSALYPYSRFYVCNYGPAGNIQGSYPYETGESGCEDLC